MHAKNCRLLLFKLPRKLQKNNHNQKPIYYAHHTRMHINTLSNIQNKKTIQMIQPQEVQSRQSIIIRNVNQTNALYAQFH